MARVNFSHRRPPAAGRSNAGSPGHCQAKLETRIPHPVSRNSHPVSQRIATEGRRERNGERQLGSYRGVSFQLAICSGKASWKLAPRANSHLPLAKKGATHRCAQVWRTLRTGHDRRSRCARVSRPRHRQRPKVSPRPSLPLFPPVQIPINESHEMRHPSVSFGTFRFRILDLFRISKFEFRIFPLPPRLKGGVIEIRQRVSR